MSGIFNGSTSDLVVTQSAAAPSYPILMAAWMKPDNVTASLTLIAASDDGAGGSLDALVLAARGDQTSDPLWATATAAGASSNASTAAVPRAFVAGQWQFVAALFTSDSSRLVKIGDSAWTLDTTTRSVGNVTKWSIGSLWNSGAGSVFAGRLAEIGIWTAVDADLAVVAAQQLQAGLQADQVWHVRNKLFVYQPLRAAANEAVGPAMTATSLTFSPTDSPFVPRTVSYRPSSADPEVPGFGWPDGASDSDAGPLPANRLCVLGTDQRIHLAAADSANWIGTTVDGGVMQAYQLVTLRGSGRPIKLDMADGATFTVGTSVAYAAADGKCDDAGTLGVGIVSRVDGTVATIAPF